MPRGAKPGERRGGRKKGTPNKFSADLKGMLIQAVHEEGGVEYFRTQAQTNATAFLALIGKVLPTTLSNDPNAPLTITIVSGVERGDKSSGG